MLINKKGKIVTRDTPFVMLSPYVTNKYYNISKTGKFSEKKLNVKKISKITFKNRYELEYAISKGNIQNGEVKTLKKNTKFKIVSFGDGWHVKIKVNGKKVYLMPTF